MQKQKLRSEIDSKYKWNLEDIYINEEEYEKDKQRLLELVDKVESFKGNIADTKENLLKYLKFSDEVSDLFTNLYIYASLKYDEDVSDTVNRKRLNEISNIESIYSEKASFIVPELMKTDYSIILKYINEDERLKEYEFDLKEIYKFQKYVLSDKEELLIGNIADLSSRFEDNFNIIINSMLNYGTIKDENNEEVELTVSNYAKYIKSKDRRVRKDAYYAKGNNLKKYVDLLSIDYEGNLKSDSMIAKAKGYSSDLQMYLYPDDVTVKMYDNLLSIAKKNLHILHKYYRLIKQVLKLDKLEVYDLSAPLTKDTDKKYTPEDARNMIISSLSIYGKEYTDILKKAFDEKWIDFYPNKGKQSGYYEIAGPKAHPYILANFTDDLKSVSGVCHELGHAVNSYFSFKNNPSRDAENRHIVAEVASLTNEILFSNYIVKNSNDKEEKLFAIENILSVFADNFFGTLADGSVFEKVVHEKTFNGEILTVDDFNNIFENIVNEEYGPDIEKNEFSKYNWSKVSHFYSSFYYYKYSIGVSCACFIANKIINNDEEFKEKYLKFLCLGDSMSPLNELKTLGIDLEKEDVFNEAINYFDKLIDEFEEIYNS